MEFKKVLKYKLKIEGDLTLDDLKKETSNGGKFIVFQYSISLFAITLKRLSPAIFIRQTEKVSKHKTRYNTRSYLFGWWGIPWGLIRTLESLKINNEGGIDVTEDIMLNITAESMKKKEVELKFTNLLFKKPDKSDTKAFHKAVLKLNGNTEINKLVVGLYLNVEDGVEPYYLIGLKTKNDYQDYIDVIKKALYTQFYKHVHFEFVGLEKEIEIHRLLEKQGEIIIPDKEQAVTR